MKKLFILFAAYLMTASVVAQDKIISPTVCGITVGQTTSKELNDKIVRSGMMHVLDVNNKREVYVGNFSVEGFKMSVLSVELANDTVYQIHLYEQSPYVNYWERCKEQAYKMRDKYADYTDYNRSTSLDSLLILYKTDGTTQMTFAIFPDKIQYTLINKRIHEVEQKKMIDELERMANGEADPNYDPKNKVTGVAGVKFGDNKATVYRKLLTKSDNIRSKDELLEVYKLDVGGTMFDFCMFHFDYKNALISAMLQKPFKIREKEEALLTLDNLRWLYKQKYSNMKLIIDEEDSKIYSCGAYESDYAYPPITLSFHKGLSNQGQLWYYVQVIYYLYKGDIYQTGDI